MRTRWPLAIAVPVVLSALPLFAQLVAALSTAGPVTPLALPAALTAGLAAVVLVFLARPRIDPRAGIVRVRVIALGVRAWHAAFLRLRDPNAPGRAQPRAPSQGTAAA